jgi:hypothetical protein
VLLIAGSFTTWSIFAHRPDGKLHVHLVKTGESSALFVKTPSGSNLLIDLAGDASETSAVLTPLLSPWDFHIDALILTKPMSETLLADLNQMLRVGSMMTSTAVLRPSAGNYPLTLPENTTLITLPAGKPVEIEPGLTLTVIGEVTEQAAYALQYGETTILIPAGVDYALLKENYPDLMQQPDLLILTPDDVSYIPPRLWSELEPKTILWNSLESSPYQGALSLNSIDRISIVSDGIQIWSTSD